jgi:surfeit locus 1 family protein
MTTPCKKPVASIVAVISAATISIILMGLGAWQLQRLQWKLELIEKVNQRVHAEPVAAPGRAVWRELRKENDEYRRLNLEGHFLEGNVTPVQASTRLGPGYWILTPFRTDEGDTVLVNRGFNPTTDAVPAGPAHVSITGLLRMSEPNGAFLHNNNPTDSESLPPNAPHSGSLGRSFLKSRGG